MPKEIERKYLVKDTSFKELATHCDIIRQGYLQRDPERTVRIRTRGNKGYITIKGLTVGISRLEFEYEIAYKDALEILSLCIPPVIVKKRYEVPYEGEIWEVDEFESPQADLITAEIELKEEDQPFKTPSFVGKEVTGDPKYYNSNIGK